MPRPETQSQADARERIRAELEADPDRSDRRIARLCGATHHVVGRERRRLNAIVVHERFQAMLQSLSRVSAATPRRMDGYCRCRRPTPARAYLGSWACAACGLPVADTADAVDPRRAVA